MEKADNEMYALVDEEFLAKFSNQHLNYMKKLYYSFYAGYCKRIKRKPLTSEDFFKNMHLRRFQLFGIEIRKNLNAETWDDLLDIVNLRNMIVHNNGQVDKRFESTSTFRRWKDRVDIPLIKIEDEDIAKLLSSVIDAVTIISNLYLKEYYQRRNRVIANYYFNKENAYDFFADTE